MSFVQPFTDGLHICLALWRPHISACPVVQRSSIDAKEFSVFLPDAVSDHLGYLLESETRKIPLQIFEIGYRGLQGILSGHPYSAIYGGFHDSLLDVLYHDLLFPGAEGIGNLPNWRLCC